jgi:hypothetical protein
MIIKIVLPFDQSDIYYLTTFSNNIVEYHMINNIFYLERFIGNKFYGITFKKKINER